MNKKTTFLAASLLCGALAIGAAVVISGGPGFLAAKAGDIYTCNLPSGYNEIHDLAAEATSLANAQGSKTTNYKVRGTLTRRFGKAGYMQRVNQTTGELDSIYLYNLPTDDATLRPGAVLDITNPTIVNYYGLPELKFDTGTTYTVSFNENPFGYEPTVYESAQDFLDEAFLNDYGEPVYSYSRFVRINDLVSPSVIATPTSATVRDLALSNKSGTKTVNLTVATESLEKTKAVINTLNHHFAAGESFDVIGNISYDYSKQVIRITSAADIEVRHESGDNKVLSSRPMSVYYLDREGYYQTTESYAVRGKSDVRYCSFEDIYDIAMWFCSYGAHNYTLAGAQEGDELVLTNEVGSFRFNDATDKVTVTNPGLCLSVQMEMPSSTDPSKTSHIFVNGIDTDHIQVTASDLIVEGAPTIEIDFGSYGIDVVVEGGKAYLPVNTTLDMLFSSNLVGMGFNGIDVYYTGAFSGAFEGTLDQGKYPEEYRYYMESPFLNIPTLSEEMAAFNYAELCFGLDFHYGLKDYRGVTRFADLFEDLGYAESLQSTDVYTVERALAQFAGEWLYEGHAGYTQVGIAGKGRASELKSAYQTKLNTNARRDGLVNAYSAMQNLRSAAGNEPSQALGLRTYNDMAVFRFDNFRKYTGNIEQLEAAYTGMDYATLLQSDTYYALRKAMEEVEAAGNIHNVVLDITTNGGGMVDSIPWLEAFFTEDPTLMIRNKTTGEIFNAHYRVDLNRDGTFDGEGDTYGDKYNFFVLTSNYSFSCGTMFPTMIKQNGSATLIGETSGGGACAVGGLTTATGTVLRSSSPFQCGRYIESEFILNEPGIEPDVPLDRSVFFNDAALSAAIQGIVA